jgi:glycosyltransferase involved in cell wall biosynthesis
MQELPLVTIVTPVYQMARFIEETISSVFAQDYPNIEYIVMDAGSTDGTVKILRRFEGLKSQNVRFRWFSEKDKGTADAVNKGFLRARGTVLAYLNADDIYTPGAVTTAVRALMENSSVDVVYGEAEWMKTDGAVIGPYPTEAFDADRLRSLCFICQPASFIRREAFDSVGMLDASLNYGYDYDLWIRFSKAHRLRKIDHLLARSRMHFDNKTLRSRRKVFRESLKILQRHYGYASLPPVLAYTAHLVDGQDQFFSPFQPSLGKYLLSLPIGWRFNWRHPIRYTREWAAVMRDARYQRRV